MKEYKEILRKNRKEITCLCILLIVASLAYVIMGYTLGAILNSVEAEGDRLAALLRNSLKPLITSIIAIVLMYAGEVGCDRMQRIIKTDLRELAAKRIAAMPYKDFMEKDSGTYVSWLNNDTDLLYTQSFDKLFRSVDYLCRTVFSLAAMCMISWFVGVAAIVLFSVMYIVPQLFDQPLRRANERRSKALEISVEAYKDTVMGTPVFYLCNLSSRIVERIASSSRVAEETIFYSNRTQRRATYTVSSVSLVNQLLLFAVTALAIILGIAPVGAILSVGNLCGTFFNGISNLVQSIMTIRSSRPLWEKFQGEETVSAAKKPLAPVEKITMEDVSFRYGERVILDQRDFVFEAGGKYAVLGESGSGKTTVLKLLMGLLPDYEGKICYDGCEQNLADLSSLYDQVAYVDQQVYLFQDTLRFNITLGQPYSDEEVMAAVKACKLEELVASLTEGLDTVISENGKSFSGGQRQRIALARGFIRKVRYMILDEGTSALDEENAVEIEQNLMENDDLGVIIITHNLHDCVRKQLTGVYQM